MLLYRFDHAHVLDKDDATDLLGGKGAGLWAMTSKLGLPVPPGFTIPTAYQSTFDEFGVTDELMEAVFNELTHVGNVVGRRFCDPDAPLLVSVRSGAASSMPGMMDTLLNVGMTRDNLQVIGRQHGGSQFAEDLYRRFLRQFGAIVLELTLAEDLSDEALYSTLEARLPAGALENPKQLLRLAIEAVFKSWNGRRAKTYRQIENLGDSPGTAVNVQAMVFGNLDENSGTGVVFSRDPSTGEKRVTGDYLTCAQGEEVVSGTVLTRPIGELAELQPAIFDQLIEMLARLEHHYQDMVDVEFTVEAGKLWLLQARRGKRSNAASARILVDLANDNAFSMTRKQAADLGRSLAASSQSLKDSGQLLTSGLGASPGLASGEVVLDPDQAIERSETADVILVRRETSPADVHGMSVAAGILTTLGGKMSHAAVVARGWGVPAVVGARDIEIERDGLSIDGVSIKSGEIISIDGTSGRVYLGKIVTESKRLEAFEVLQNWRDAESKI